MRRRRRGLDIDWSVERLVAVHFMNGLGNFIQMTPSIQALAKYYGAYVDIVLDRKWTDSRRESVEELCRHWNLIEKVYDFQDGFNRHNYVQLFYARHGENCEAAAFFRENSGYEADHINWRVEKLNEVDYYMKEVYKLGYRGRVPEMYPVTFMQQPKGIEHEANLPELQRKYFRIGFCNGFFAGSAWKWERKGWPHFPELARLLRRHFGRSDASHVRITLLGRGENEQEWARTVKKVEAEFEKEKYPWIYDCTSGYNLVDTIKYLYGADLIVTTDTGLMHVADSLKTPMVALFGPTILSKNGPYNREHRVARSPLQCAPCQGSHHFYACEDWRCMRELKPWMVMLTVRKYLYDLVVRKHHKVMEMDKERVEEYNEIMEEEKEETRAKRLNKWYRKGNDPRGVRGCILGKMG